LEKNDKKCKSPFNKISGHWAEEQRLEAVLLGRGSFLSEGFLLLLFLLSGSGISSSGLLGRLL
jgi:hypothetical protein